MNSFPQNLAFVAAICLAGIALADGSETQPAAPATQATAEVLDPLQAQLRQVNSVQADFVEKRNLAMLNHQLTISGRFALQKPDRLIWIVTAPLRYAIRIEGDEVQQWDEDTNHVDVIHLGGDPAFKSISDQMKAWFLGDYSALATNYDALLIGRNPLALEFVPKPDSMVAKMISKIGLSFEADERYIDTMSVVESSGDTTSVHFSNARINQPVSEATWEMPPHER
jgi:outer membrane lipoprotein carrier protein